MGDSQRKAATTLGFNKEKWDKNKRTHTDDKEWLELSNEERQAAAVLGYTQAAWDADD